MKDVLQMEMTKNKNLGIFLRLPIKCLRYFKFKQEMEYSISFSVSKTSKSLNGRDFKQL